MPDPTLAMMRVQTLLVNEMTPEQRARAASALRELSGEESERKFFGQIADGLEEVNAAQDDPGA